MNATFKTLVVAVAAVLAVPSLAYCQSPRQPAHPLVYVLERSGCPHYAWASTFEQGYLDGLANLYRGVGDYLVRYSEACFIMQQVREAWLKNNRLEWQMKLERKANWQANARRESREIAERNLARQQRTVAPPKLYVDGHGTIHWPVELLHEQLEVQRSSLELEFRQLAAGRMESALAINEQLEQLQSVVGRKVRSGKFPGTMLTAAVSFCNQSGSQARNWSKNSSRLEVGEIGN